MTDENTIGELVGWRLRELREKAGLTQSQLADRAGMGRPNLARAESGRHSQSLDTIARIAKALDVMVIEVVCAVDGLEDLDIEVEADE